MYSIVSGSSELPYSHPRQPSTLSQVTHQVEEGESKEPVYSLMTFEILNKFGQLFCTYKGEVKEGQAHGLAYLKYADESQVQKIGYWKMGKVEGLLARLTKDNWRIGFCRDELEGQIFLKTIEKSEDVLDSIYYFGELKERKKSGLGIACQVRHMNSSLPSLAFYIGSWEDDKRVGKGSYVCISKETTIFYKGWWANDQCNGPGVLTMHSTTHEKTMIGYFRDDIMVRECGLDVELDNYELINGQNSVYLGLAQDKIWHGLGAFLEKGTIYLGVWDKEGGLGKGAIIQANGDTYFGNWINGTMEGKGVFISEPENTMHLGAWSNNQKQGKGLTVEGEEVSLSYWKDEHITQITHE